MTGLEQRGCWQERHATEPAPADAQPDRRPWTPRVTDDAGLAPAQLDFIPVELVARIALPTQPTSPVGGGSEPPVSALAPPIGAEANETSTERTSLFGELEA